METTERNITHKSIFGKLDNSNKPACLQKSDRRLSHATWSDVIH